MPKTRYGQPWWIARSAKSRVPDRPRLRGTVESDVAIVGGGMTGCAIAYVFAMAGVDTVVIEADRIGRAGTAAGCGVATADPPVPFASLEASHGPRAARHLWQAMRRATLDFAATLRRLRARCDLAACDAVRLALTAEEGESLRREARARRAAGIEATWVTGPRLGRDLRVAATAGIRTGGAFTFDPYRACLAFARAAAARGAELYERSPVARICTGPKGVELRTEGGSVRAGTVIVATAMPAGEFRPLARHFTRLDSYRVVTAPLPGQVRRQVAPEAVVLLEAGGRSRVLRWASDDRLMFAGADQPPVPAQSRPRTLVQRTGQLMYELSVRYPAVSGCPPEAGWDQPVAESADGVMVAGPHRNYPHHLFALGLGPNGPGLSLLAARLLLRQHAGQPERGDDLFGFARLLGR